MRRLENRHIAILADKEYEDLELWYPRFRLLEEGARITVVGSGARSYLSKHGYEVKTDASAEEVSADVFDAVVIPGGYAPDHMRRNPAMVDLVRKADGQGKVIAAICHAGWMLVSAGILRGRRVTGFFSIKDDLVNAGAHYEDAPVVRDGNLITSRFPGDLPDFCRAIIEEVSEKAAAPNK